MNKLSFLLFLFNFILSIIVLLLLLIVGNSTLHYIATILVILSGVWNQNMLSKSLVEFSEQEARKKFWSYVDPETGWGEIHEGHHVAVGNYRPLNPNWNKDKGIFNP